MAGRPGYGIDVLTEEVIASLESNDIDFKSFNKFTDEFKKQPLETKKRIIAEVFSIQSEYLYDAFANNQDNIYIPFIGCFKPRLKARVRKDLKEQNIEFTDEDVNTKARELYKENVKKGHSIEEITVTVSNLEEIFNKYKT